MVAKRRRSAKKQPSQSPDGNNEDAPSALSPNSGDATELPNETSERSTDLCRACKVDAVNQVTDASKENWVRCDSCKTWYHWRCVGEGDDLETVGKWYSFVTYMLMFLY